MSILYSGAKLPTVCVDGLHDSGGNRLELSVPQSLLSRGRGIRVLMLAALVAILSAADLYITGLYLSTTGMAEENPLARLVMSSGSMGYLSVWKLMTIVPALALMIGYRHRLFVELLGWVACGVLIVVMIRWMQYASETHLLVSALDALQNNADGRWVSHVSRPAS